MSFREVDIKELSFNPFTRIGSEWMLVTAGDESGYNTMTASWGGLGYLWGKNVATIYVRPQRYTKQFVDKADTFTLSFYDVPKYREALNICGTLSGRDCDKAKKAGLTPFFVDGTTAFNEASLIFVCRKLYADELEERLFLDHETVDAHYPQRDFHTLYVAEITKVLVKQ